MHPKKTHNQKKNKIQSKQTKRTTIINKKTL